MENENTIKRLPKINYELEIINICNGVLATQAVLNKEMQNQEIMLLCNILITRNMASIERVTNTYAGPKVAI